MKDWRWAKAFQNASLNQNKLGNSTQRKKHKVVRTTLTEKRRTEHKRGRGEPTFSNYVFIVVIEKKGHET
jgi:hypothetical protein